MTNLPYRRGIAWAVVCFSLAFAPVTRAQVDDNQAGQTPAEQTQQLLAPIALYPDALLAQILAAATNPAQVVAAWNWLQQHRDLQGSQLVDAVNSQPWDPSVKALTQFPLVLQNMTANLSWTSALGDAYVNGAQDLLDAVQWLRRQAQQAGSLQSNGQQSLSSDGQTITIEPADPGVVYVPTYDPWLVYGAPLAVYPGWVGVPGLFYDGSGVYFGAGIAIGLFAGFGWGLNEWSIDWFARRPLFHHQPFFARGRTFFDRHDRGDVRAGRDVRRGRDFGHGVAGPVFHDVGHGQVGVNRAPGQRMQPAPRVGAFSGFDHGGVVRGFADRGRASVAGGFQHAAPAAGIQHQAPASGFQHEAPTGGARAGMAAGGGSHGFAGGGFRGGDGGGHR
jgi:hypothetical protein